MTTKQRVGIALAGLGIVIASLYSLIYRFENPSLTETQLMLATAPVVVPALALLFFGAWIMRSGAR